MEKNILARVAQKHDIEANWNNATDFVPMRGEIIVYDIDDIYNYERMKIGDGATTVTDLPFCGLDMTDPNTVVVDISSINSGDANLINADTLGGRLASDYALKSELDNISWSSLGEEEVVFIEGSNITFTDDGVEMQSNGVPAVGDFVIIEFDGVSGEYEVTELFGSLSIEADGVTITYEGEIAYVFADDTTQPHSVKMTGKQVTKIPDRYAAAPCAKFYIDQFGKTYLSFDMVGEQHITKDDLLAAAISKPVVISLGDTEFYSPIVVNPYDGDETYGSVTIMKADGTLETYYTSEYVAEEA